MSDIVRKGPMIKVRLTEYEATLLESLVEHREERLLLGGTANLTRNSADFGSSLRPITRTNCISSRFFRIASTATPRTASISDRTHGWR